jgi:hypothetical protein
VHCLLHGAARFEPKAEPAEAIFLARNFHGAMPKEPHTNLLRRGFNNSAPGKLERRNALNAAFSVWRK